MNFRRLPCLLTLLTMTCGVSLTHAQTREEIVRGDRQRVEAAGFWMYNDIPGAIAEAKRTGKPIVVVLRCLPCHECVKLDDELVETHPLVRPLLEKFVCVRQISTNGLDLDLFQFDTDQSFAVFMLNADKTIYGRFGTRSHRTDWQDDVSLEGLAKALEGALELHAKQQVFKAALSGKRGKPMEFASPELYPSLKGSYTDKLNYQGDVVKSCIHCHQIGDAKRDYYWQNNKPIPDRILYPYPHPKAVGLILDPLERAKVKSVRGDTPAASAGFRNGDVIESLNGQPLLSIADVQWVLHNVEPSGGEVAAKVLRGDQRVSLKLKLDDGWRRESDLSWRVSTWGLRRMAAGGLVLEQATNDAREDLSIDDNQMALHIKRAGRYGPHATARRNGFREGDIIVRFDGRDDLDSEQKLLTYVVQNRKPGDRVQVTVVRDGRKRNLQLPIQK